MEDDPASQEDLQANIVQHNIRELLDSNLPNQIAQLEESTVSLERVAAYCEANYIQCQNKAAALAETKRYALQSLAGVAYLVGELSRSLLHALELEQLNLAQKTSEIRIINQLVAIQKEKAARREIGKLTTAKNVLRQNKISYPATEERSPRYQRTPIDFSLLDGIGHGRRAVVANNVNEYGSIGYAAAGGYAAPAGGAGIGIYADRMQLNRTGSSTSGESGGGGSGSGASSGLQSVPIYEHYARTGSQGTLTRGSVRSTPTAMHDQYRVPQPIPSALQQQQQVRGHYQSMAHQQMMMGMDQQQQQRYESSLTLNGHNNGLAAHQQQLMMNNGNQLENNNSGHYDYEQQQQYGTLRASQQQQHGNYVSRAGHHQQQQQQHGNGLAAGNNLHLQPQAALGHVNSGGGALDPMNISADNSDDGLPLPPPLLMSGQQPHQQQRFSAAQQQHLDDGFPMPPPPHPQVLGQQPQQQQQNQHAAQQQNDWVPQQYLEKAYVLYDYESRNPDELRLYQGAVVYILRKNEDGWFEGVMDGITGLFPGNYVQPLST